MDELLFRPVGELAALVKAGEVKPRELVEGSLRRIETYDPHLNAFVDVAGDEAMAEADAMERSDPRPFAGVPIAVKNNVPVKGMRMTLASAFFEDFRSDHDAYLVERLRAAGFVIVGTTTLPEFGILPTTESRRLGPTRNPWDPDRTPGGSSGGSAAAVAGGLVPLAHGNDGGGSIRIPAACCGLVGLKPSRGRVSRGPEFGDSFLVSDGVLSHTVQDTAAALDVLAGYEVGDANWAPKPGEPFFLAARKAPGRLSIAFTHRSPIDATIDPEAERGLMYAVELLEALGHQVEEAAPSFDGFEGLLPVFAAVYGPNIAMGVEFGKLLAGREPGQDDIEPLTRHLYERARRETSIELLMATTRLQMYARRLVAFFADYDILLTPALAERPLPIGECTGFGEDPAADFARSAQFTPYTALFNVTGQPAITMPVGFGEDGLPTAVQMVGHPLGEETLLQLATQMETARGTGSPERRPALEVPS